jgi:hypothetical protein
MVWVIALVYTLRYKFTHFSNFYFGEFLKIAKIGQNYIPAKKPAMVYNPGYSYFDIYTFLLTYNMSIV